MFACPLLRCWRIDPLHPLLFPEPHSFGQWRLPLRTDFRCVLRPYTLTFIPTGIAIQPTTPIPLKITAAPSQIDCVVDMDIVPRLGDRVQNITECVVAVTYLGKVPLEITRHSDLFRCTAMIPGLRSRTF